MRINQKNRNRTIGLFIFLSWVTVANAQSQNNEIKTVSVETNKLGISISYFGEFLTHPGAKLGLEYILLEKNGNKLISGFNLGYWGQYRISNNLFAVADIGYRYTFRSGFFLEAIVGAGYNHIIPDGKIYNYSGGVISQGSNTGYGVFMPVGSIGIGYHLGYEKGNPGAQLYLRPTFFGQFPVANTFIPNIALEAGITIPIGSTGKNKIQKENL